MIPEPQRTYLLELLTALGPAAQGLTLVGGHGLRFMIARPRVTRDFDFVLDVAYLRKVVQSPLARYAREGRKTTLQALFKTMLHHLMTGKIRVEDL